MYEVETKIELSDAEATEYRGKLSALGFKPAGKTSIYDVYVEARKSPHGGYDVRRYRHEDDEYMLAEKSWELVNGSPARREDEREATKEEFERADSEHPSAIRISKDRETFSGSFQGSPLTVTIDSVKFDHSPKVRRFTEAEIVVEGADKVAGAKALVEGFLKAALGRERLVESPGMFALAFKKL